MKRKRLVLILGAGASSPYGFPTGQELVAKVQGHILRKLFAGFSAHLAMRDTDLDAFQDDLRLSGLGSIDAFLENNSRYQKVGKIIIAYFLNKYESYEFLYSLDIKDNWYQYLVDKMLRNYPFSAIEANQISFITYNYDRSLEFYLYNAFKRSNETISDDDCLNKVRQFPIVHLHGSLGEPQFMEKLPGKPYSPKQTPEQLQTSASSIHIISEDVEKYPEFHKAHQLITQADDIAFLGFGFHPVNVERLWINRLIRSETALWGSCKGKTESEKQYLIGAQFKSPPGITLHSESNTGFLSTHVDLLVGGDQAL